MRIPFFLFIVLPVLGAIVLLWCVLCYKIGAWLVEGLFPRRRRPVYADIPVREPYRPPQPPPPPRMRSGRRGGGGGAFLTLLVVLAVVLGFTSFTHQKRERARAFEDREHARATAYKTVTKPGKKPRRPEPPAPPVAVVDRREAVIGADANEELASLPELPRDEQRSGWVLGYGKSREEAEQNAQEKAYDKALAHLHENLPGVQWTPNREYVRTHLVKELRNLPPREMDNLGLVSQVSLRVEVSPADTQDIIKQDRHDRVEQRMGLLAKILGAIVLLCATVAAYVRIDEYSKGYLTGWLRVAGIVGVAAAGLIFLMR